MSYFRRPAADPTRIEVIGAPSTPLSDLYHLVLRAPWWLDLLGVGTIFLVINLVFAVAYLVTGGIAGARAGSLSDLFFFSVQTMGTIGYGNMFPNSPTAHALVTVEAMVGISLVAITTGMLFAKFSVPRARMQFAETVTISPFNGQPSLMIRIGNERATQIIEAVVRVVLMRTERTSEGVTMYRMYDLRLERERSPAIARSWTVLHKIERDSPLWEATPAVLARDEIDLIITVTGIDDTSAQNLHARHVYKHDQIRWGARHADMLSERPDGSLILDMRQFHKLLPTAPTALFPYPAP